MYADQGLGGFFKGLAPSMIMVINPTIQYILYESLVARALEWQRSRRAAHAAPRHAAGPAAAATAAAAAVQRHAGGAAAGGKAGGMALGALDIFVLSALAKIGATLVTYPLLVVKNRLQVGGVAALYSCACVDDTCCISRSSSSHATAAKPMGWGRAEMAAEERRSA